VTHDVDSTSGRGPRLVVVTGAGRSGTSTVAGTLKQLGLAIPQPELRANASNPRGFFEPRWVVAFHKRLLLEAEVATLDARPAAMRKVTAVGKRPEVRRDLREWLAQAVEPQFLIKDPRTFWLHSLWRDTAAELGVDLCLLTMLRHPAEVVGSRRAHYAREETKAQRRWRETGLLAGWVNVALHNERAFRGEQRVFVHYQDLLTDWRTVALRIGAALDLEYDTNLASGNPHPVDDFIDVNLHRVRTTLGELDVPESLARLAEDVWDCLMDLADKEGNNHGATARLDHHRMEYNALFEHSKALVQDSTEARIRRDRDTTRRLVEEEMSEAGTPRSHLTRGIVAKARSLWSSRILD
jgi:hypothetical protein